MRLQPGRGGLEVAVRKTELAAELLWSKPLVVVGGVLNLLVGEELAQSSFLFRAAFQYQEHSVHRQISSRRP
ncbi:MAG: hypothetical protein WAM86_18125 [Candidatus Sulfotelmatobacter sp.]